MFKFIFLIIFVGLTLNADVFDFYKGILKTLQYDKTYSLYKQANSMQKDGITYNKYANFALDADYSKTKASLLPNTFDTINIGFNDTIDLFGKSNYKIKELALNVQAEKTLLDMQKEQLFVSLVSMISVYYQTEERLTLHQSLLDEQQSIYDKLQTLQQSGIVSQIDLLRFKNTLSQLKIRIIDEKTTVQKMKRQLNLYAPNQEIPLLKHLTLECTKEDFLSQNQQKKLNAIAAKQLWVQAQNASHSYLPDVTVGMNYQQLNDPTSYGNNYSLNVAIHMPLSATDFKQSEALKVSALSLKSKDIEYKIQRENEYTQRFQDYQSATNQLAVLTDNIVDYEKSEGIIKTAYLKQYVDFNTFLQVLTESLNAKEQIITLIYQQSEQIIILNAIASGAIYE